DALFAPLVARQALVATQAGLRRVNNDTLLAVADAYLNVLRARRRLARVEEPPDYLTSEQPSKFRAGSRGLLPGVIAVQAAGGPDPNVVITPATGTTPAKITTVPGFGPSGQIHHFAPRSDFDVSLVWRLQNLGLGNRAEIREQQAISRQASLRLLRTQDGVVT